MYLNLYKLCIYFVSLFDKFSNKGNGTTILSLTPIKDPRWLKYHPNKQLVQSKQLSKL